jgi:hypothetical protein
MLHRLILLAALAAPLAAGCNEGPTKVQVPDGPVTAKTLELFLPEKMGGAEAMSRKAQDDKLAASAYRTSTGFINVNLSLVRSLSFQRAQVEGEEQTMVGKHKARRVVYESGSQSELHLLLSDRISVYVSVEGSVPTSRLVELAQAIDLDGLDALASRIPEPAP